MVRTLARRNYRGNRYANYGLIGSAARYLYNNRQGLRNGILSRFRMRNMSTTQTRGKMYSSAQGVTNQYDRKLIYRKKSMPRFKRSAWKKFKSKVIAVSTKSLGSSTVVRNTLITSNLNLLPGNNNVQNTVQLALYPVRSTTTELDDVNQIATDTRLNNSSKIIFMSGVLDLTLRVQTVWSGIGPPSPAGNPSFSVEIDIYELSMRGATGQSGEATDLSDAFDKGHTDTGNIPGAVTGLTKNTRGWTPFEANEALSQHKIKIWKKTKYFLSSEQTLTYQMRDPKTHLFSKDSIPSAASANWPGVTKWLYIVWKPVPGYNYVAAPNNDQINVIFGVTRKYLYKINQDSTDYDAVL